MALPKQGRSPADVLASLDTMRESDADWRRGRTFSLVYWATDEHTKLLHDAYGRFFMENGLNPMAFPSLRRFETEVLATAAELFHGPDAVGSMTTGGTESILMAVKAAREWARANKPHVTRPKMLVPTTIHPAFEKAAHYFTVEAVHMPVGADFRVDLAKAEALLDDDVILIVGSAPSYPQGVIDPIPALAALAKSRGILCHVDACLGGFLLPFVEQLGRPVDPWDFRVDGVTSISADLHKYGFAAKGASCVLYRDRALRKHQFCSYSRWPGGLWASPSMTGTRAGGALAAAWACMQHLGEDGYLAQAKEILATTDRFLEGIRAIPELQVMGAPVMSVFGFTSDVVDVYGLGDAMEALGWKLDRLMDPPGLHCMITPVHAPVIGEFLADLRSCIGRLQAGEPAPDGSAAMYGMMGSLPDRGAVDDILKDFLDGLG